MADGLWFVHTSNLDTEGCVARVAWETYVQHKGFVKPPMLTECTAVYKGKTRFPISPQPRGLLGHQSTPWWAESQPYASLCFWCAAWTGDSPFYYRQLLMDLFFLHERLMQHIIKHGRWMPGLELRPELYWLSFKCWYSQVLGRFGNALGTGSWTPWLAQGAAALLGAHVLRWAKKQGWGSHCQKLAPATALPRRARSWCCTVENEVVILMFPLFIFFFGQTINLLL